MTTNSKDTEVNKYRLYDAYGLSFPEIPRPKPDLSKPESRLEKMYCWRYYLDLLLNPESTGWVLDNLEQLPTFNAEWGCRPERGKLHKRGKLMKTIPDRHKQTPVGYKYVKIQEKNKKISKKRPNNS